MIDVIKYNSAAWDREVEQACNWTTPVSTEIIEAARLGDWSILLTPVKPVPREWFGDVVGKEILCLASGGGQQVPILAAAGASVTSFDNSAKQLEQDLFVARRDNLQIRIEKGDSADLSRFANASFDLIFHPCSNCFMPVLQPIWDECFRVLRSGGVLLVGFTKPELFVFDQFEEDRTGKLVLRHSLPYADETSLTEDELREKVESGDPLEFSHTLEEQLGGQTAAGFHITGLFEDYWNSPGRPIDRYMPTFIATRAIKP